MARVRRINGTLHVTVQYPMTDDEHEFAKMAAKAGGFFGVDIAALRRTLWMQ